MDPAMMLTILLQTCHRVDLSILRKQICQTLLISSRCSFSRRRRDS